MWSRLLRYFGRYGVKKLPGAERIIGVSNIAETARMPSLFRTVGEDVYAAVKWGAKWVGRPLAFGYGLERLGGYVRSALGIETPEEKAKEQLEIEKQQLEQAKREFEFFKDVQNYLRSKQDPFYRSGTATLPFSPEWMNDLPTNFNYQFGKTGTEETKPTGGGFSFIDIALPVAAIGLLAFALLKKR